METVFIADLVRGKEQVIVQTIFRECIIEGPVFLKLGNNNDINFCSVPNDPRMSLTPLLDGVPITGAVLLSRTTFDRCFFNEGVAFLGTIEDIKLLHPALDRANLDEWMCRRPNIKHQLN
ncbi:MAG: hypothetical protein AB7H90_23035 [Alphaproteobacteria bacterium]